MQGFSGIHTKDLGLNVTTGLSNRRVADDAGTLCPVRLASTDGW